MLWRLGRDWLGEGEDEEEKGGKEKEGQRMIILDGIVFNYF